MRRGREEDEALELYAALLRQSGARAVERVRQRRSSIMPIDALVLRYAMHFLDSSLFPPASYMAQAQAVVAEAIERVAQPQHFEYTPLPALVESLVAENTAEVMQRTVASLEEFIDARDALGRWIDENCRDENDENDRNNNNNNGDDEDEDEQRDAAVWRAAAVWRSARYWVAVHEYIDALSLGSAQVHAFALRPRYEKELMDILNAAAREEREKEKDKDKDNNNNNNNNSSSVSLSALLADLTALANCSDVPGLSAAYFAMSHARLNVIATCDRLARFSARARVAAPPLTPQLTALQAQRDAVSGDAARRRRSEAESRDGIGVPLDFVTNEAYMRSVLEKQNDTLGEDEELFRDEIVDYYKNHPPKQQQQQQQQQQQSRQRQREKEKKEETQVALVKPHRFCKVKTGYTWTQYNRTHYDTRTNPPPRSVMWYEFTLFYPALVDTKRDMSRIYHIEDTPRGPNDTYCILVFSVGPPYADVAYQIVRKQWDPRPGGVRASFDATGTYRLFFRFTNSNYRR